jgi:hypothetical protein
MILEHTGMKVLNDNTPFYFEISKLHSTPDDVQHDFKALALAAPTAQEIARNLAKEGLIQHKYDHFVPEHLLREAIAVDVLDVEGAKSSPKKTETLCWFSTDGQKYMCSLIGTLSRRAHVLTHFHLTYQRIDRLARSCLGV